MRTITALPNARIPLGRQGENEAARVVWPGIAEKYRTLYGEGIFALGVQRSDETEAHPAALTREGDNLVWVVTAEDTAAAGIDRAELQYLVGETVAKSQTWTTEVYRALAPIAPSGEPGAAWYAAVQAQIGDLNALTTRAKDNLVAAINEAAKSGGGGGTAAKVEMRVEDGCIQYTRDGGATWESLIAPEELKGEDGKDGEPGKDGAAGSPGADGYSPSAKVEQTATGATITITDRDGTTTASVTNGKDGAPGAKGDPGEDYTLTEGDKSEIAALAAALVPSSGGSGEVWELIGTVEITEEVGSTMLSKDLSNAPFELKKLVIYAPLGLTTSENSQFLVSLGTRLDSRISFSSMNNAVKTTGSSAWAEFEVCGPYFREFFVSSTYDINGVASSDLSVRINSFTDPRITSITVMPQTGITFTAGTLYFYGVRA